MALDSIDLSGMSEKEQKSIDKYSEVFDKELSGGGRTDWQKVSETKNLISYHEGRKSVIDEMLSKK
jgi:hypothetical protein